MAVGAVIYVYYVLNLILGARNYIIHVTFKYVKYRSHKADWNIDTIRSPISPTATMISEDILFISH